MCVSECEIHYRRQLKPSFVHEQKLGDFTHLRMLLDWDESPHRQSDGLLVVDVHELALSSWGLASTLNTRDF